MNAQLQHQKTQANFEKIKKRVGNAESGVVLDSINEATPSLFDETTINTILTLAALSEYTINNFSDILCLRNLNLFSEFVSSTSEEDLKGYGLVFDIYFEAITIGCSMSAAVVKNKILTLLKLKITIPNSSNNFTLKNISATVSSTYKPKKSNRGVAACDISNIIKTNFYNAVENAQVEKFAYTTWTNNTNIQGPVLSMLLSNMVLYQQCLLETAASCGVEVEPFLVNNTSNKLLYQ